MNKNYFLFGAGGLVIGLIIGFIAANTINRNAFTQPTTAAQNVPISNAPFLNSQPNSAVQTTQSGMLAQVNETLEKAKNEPDNFDAQVKAGDMYAQIQKFDKAAEFYEKAHKIKPDDYQTIVNIGNTFFDSKQFESAEKWYSEALAKNPDDVNVRTDLGVTFVERANPDFDRAAREFETSLQKNPRHEPTLYNLGIAYFKKGNSEEAQKTLQQLETINPQSQLATRLRQIISQN
ncbi:MAG TPA: tetratricopeptide repeat protein [Pyrinomonadaceae bacterium]|jgi:tetratricopeptide (TPR) repeat protein